MVVKDCYYSQIVVRGAEHRHRDSMFDVIFESSDHRTTIDGTLMRFTVAFQFSPGAHTHYYTGVSATSSSSEVRSALSMSLSLAGSLRDVQHIDEVVVGSGPVLLPIPALLAARDR